MEQLCIHLSDLSGQGQYLVDYDYLTQLFTPGEIQSLHSCLVHLLRQALAQPDRPISQLSLLTPPQEEQVSMPSMPPGVPWTPKDFMPALPGVWSSSPTASP